MLLTLLVSAAAEAIILHPEHDNLGSLRDLPPDDILGTFATGSATAISPYYFLAARHQGIASTATFGGQTYNVTATYRISSDIDLRLVRIDLDGPPLANYAPLWEGSSLSGMELAIGGFGSTRGAAINQPAKVGYEWGAASNDPIWGFNVIESHAAFDDTEAMFARFGPTSHPSSAVGEATVGLGDSGGGWLVHDDGQWYTAGLTIAVQNLEEAIYGPQPEQLWAVDLTYEPYHTFITERLILPDPGHLLGDMNLDGVVDAVDVAPFVLALTDPALYESEYGIAPLLVGDINGDGWFDAVDVAPFVELLVNGGVSASAITIPEPTTGVLLATTGAILLLTRRRRRPIT
ncbi:MAG: PEP-CTERM sorting domain-containing protein [Phycisphaeraceae bacterium]